ncbi:uncharacterized protein LOC120715604 [Simochromis diagramma]|uniref:uncharacterized protein LOC120715604 n=1 Tax=Simochromis diagramma TaxID=43689 RepID=UPI001A7E9FCF|nr:uncharacterized protein LOC120715604 [Simochromis diagramma]XP_039858604.1 uncharacterized protein LOC120715604 [Simochromis diagramma]XP_039858605.1 uncharacterized protein LOC120715604 [Simochromis diagramma]XP_039858606.1 uncharacterized protein LOC120715604 [Simochromis diagramma]XP_039858607.1 uncharacterized protein LOC120715604 [Simochromis diagramma]XP_039858610.1 uncharacterized protein LOC120715604 [Simochromis diagramma]XP_039858611.1 uncharacterized protein LOC120715604 [Simoch
MEGSEQQTMAQRIQELENELRDLKTASVDTERPSTSTGATGSESETMRPNPVVYVQQDRKLPTFSGKLDNMGSLTLDEWIEQMRDFVRTRGRTEKEQAQIIFNHLEGTARTEIKFLPKEQKENVEKIFDTLKEMYSCLDSHISLQRRFFNRKQLEGESLIDFSHSLMALMDQIIKTDEEAARKASKDLRDQFCDGVRDQTLRIRLRDLINANPQWRIREARAEATRWMAQYENQPFRSRYNQSVSVSADMQASCESVDSRTSEYAELVSLFKAQQTQLELVIKALNPQEVAASSNRTSRRRRTVNGKPICFRCEQIGHIAQFCPTLPNSDGNQHERAARADGQTTGAAEN